MLDANVYYCWACDAHCKAAIEPGGRALCSHCDRELTPDSRLPLPAFPSAAKSSTPRNAWAAPVRPRFAASA